MNLLFVYLLYIYGKRYIMSIISFKRQVSVVFVEIVYIVHTSFACK